MIGPQGLSFSIGTGARRRSLVRWLAVCILLLGAGFRLGALGRDARFHPDEAFFSTFARRAAVQGDWLMQGNLDKPPVAIYASALSMALFGVQPDALGVLDLNVRTGEFAARLPSALAGVMWVALMMALAQRIYRRPVFALWTGLFAALSPMAILFSASAFTDFWMLLWMTAALWAVAGARWGWSGLFVGLAFASKAQGLFYLPLALGMGWALHGWSWRAIGRLLLPVAGVTGLLALWDSLRTASPSVFALAAEHNAPTRFASAGELAPHAQVWLGYARGLFGPTTALLAFLTALFSVPSLFRHPRTRAMNADLVLLMFVLTYALGHWLIAFNTYDRYWLPLLPPLALLGVRAAIWAYATVTRWVPRAELELLAFVLAAVLLAAAVDAARGAPGYARDSGSSFSEDNGIEAVADWLARQHVAAVIYDHWLGWQLDYYLGTWSDKRRVYYPTPSALAEDAARLNEPQPRFFPVPDGEDAAPWLEALADVGFRADIALDGRGITVYQLERGPS